MNFRFQSLNHLTWWQRTTLLMATMLIIGCMFSLVLLTYISTAGFDDRLGRVLAFSAFPLAIVILIGVATRAQERIDVRGGSPSVARSAENGKTSNTRGAVS